MIARQPARDDAVVSLLGTGTAGPAPRHRAAPMLRQSPGSSPTAHPDNEIVDLTAAPPAPGAAPLELTVIVATRNEAGSVTQLVSRTEVALRGIDAEILFVDDSDDETPNVVLRAGVRAALPVRLLHRPAGERFGGLGGAVQAGLASTVAVWVVVMDGDLQQPPETIPQLLAEGIARDLDIVTASRYRDDGAAAGLASPLRKLASSGATLAARATLPRLLRGVSDPTSGFFALRREIVSPEELRRPRGFKILLEILARGSATRVDEVAATFAERHDGQSKASSREALHYLRQLLALRLAASRPLHTKLIKFGAVGTSGVLINLLALHLLLSASLGDTAAATISTQIAIVWNFLLTEAWVFGRGHAGARWRRAAAFWLLNTAILAIQLPLASALAGLAQLDYLLATALALGILVTIRFFVLDRLVYRSRMRPSPGSVVPPTGAAHLALGDPLPVLTTPPAGRSSVRYALRLAFPPLITLAVFPGVIMTLSDVGPTGVAWAVVLLCSWSVLWVGVAASRPGEPDVHDRQLDVILGLPLLGAASWLLLAFEPASSFSIALPGQGVIALALFLGGASLLLLGTRLTFRLRGVLLLPLLTMPALADRPGLVVPIVVIAGAALLARPVRRLQNDRLGALARQGWSSARVQPLPGVKFSLALVGAVGLMLGLIGAAQQSGAPSVVPAAAIGDRVPSAAAPPAVLTPRNSGAVTFPLPAAP